MTISFDGIGIANFFCFLSESVGVMHFSAVCGPAAIHSGSRRKIQPEMSCDPSGKMWLGGATPD